MPCVCILKLEPFLIPLALLSVITPSDYRYDNNNDDDNNNNDNNNNDDDDNNNDDSRIEDP